MQKQDRNNALLPNSTELGKQNIKMIVKNTYYKKKKKMVKGKKKKKKNQHQLLSKVKPCLI